MKPIIGVMPLWDEDKGSLWMLPGYLDGIRGAGGLPVIFRSRFHGNLELIARAALRRVFGGHYKKGFLSFIKNSPLKVYFLRFRMQTCFVGKLGQIPCFSCWCGVCIWRMRSLSAFAHQGRRKKVVKGKKCLRVNFMLYVSRHN